MTNLGQRLNDFRLNGGQLCDLDLVACDSDVVVKCHKLVLMASSDYFYKMLSCGMQESRAESISLSDCRYEVLSILIEFFYTAETPSGISCDNILELFSWAIRCDSTALCRHCSNFIDNALGCDNVLNIYAFAVGHNLKNLRAQCLQFMQNNFEEMVKLNSEEWLAVSRETMEEVISSDYLRVCSEDTILLMLLQWTERHPEHRDILAHTRTNYLSKRIFDDYKDLLKGVGAPPARQIPRRNIFIVHMAPVQDILYCIVRVQSGGSVELQMFLNSLFRWQTFLSLDNDAYRIIHTTTDVIYILGREGSLTRINLTNNTTRPECLCANPEADWLDCEAVALPSGQLLVHGRDTEEFTTFEFDPSALNWSLLCTRTAISVKSYHLFISDMEAYLVEDTMHCIRVLLWTVVDSGYRWEKVCEIEHMYERLVGPVSWYHYDQ
ncbi:kelch repeat and BTB domain-containing protein 12-like isoform X3 [Varroa jacobsoni]|uniref:kelch repeat and BTB domain-containing protein 12-like isoform X3 n=1 Tax=Varroa jacobsoni TaxID=62625 RepID=UPI000BF86D61|nr:kelch repeat and BTB domain-containing protein 12-like isoform X3 [Varroa jacobsoni]